VRKPSGTDNSSRLPDRITVVGPHAAAHTVLDSSTRLPWLADAIVVRPPGYLVSLSIGDLVLAAAWCCSS
jgi:hypothetical protein